MELGDILALSLLGHLLTHGSLSTHAWNILVSAKAYLGANLFHGVVSHCGTAHVSTVKQWIDRPERIAA
jgi:hypothetical protein